MSASRPRVVIIGDAYVPSASIAEAIRLTLGGHAVELIERDWDIPGGGPAVHAIQHQAEIHGPDSVQVPADLIDLAITADILIVHFFPVQSVILTRANSLSAIIIARAGIENVDAELARQHDVALRSIAGRNAPAVAELTLGLILAEMRNIARADRSIAAGGWQKEFRSRSSELGGRTIGLVGYGQVARRFVQLLSGFQVTVLASDPFADHETMRSDGVSAVTFDEIFEYADVIAVFARLTDENERFIGADQFAKMKPTAHFVNTARSRLVDYEALLEALTLGKIAGAALDVFDDEPLPMDSPWRSMDNVTLTTHYAGGTPESFARSGQMVADVLSDLLLSGR